MVDDGAQPTRRIGDVPEGAPLQCRLGRHVGRKDGGLMSRPRPPAEPLRRADIARPGPRGAAPDRVHLRWSRPRA
jgi:hypothetical protein